MQLSRLSCISLVCALVQLSALFATDAEALVSGEFEVGYQNVDSRTDYGDSSSSSFYHRYSLMYDKRGRLGKGGAYGAYGLMLGYEWASVDGAIKQNGNDVGSDIATGHLLYDVNYNFKSRTLPLTVSLYSRDVSRMRFTGSEEAISFETGNTLVPVGVVDSVANTGSRIASGLTLVFGEIASDPSKARYPRFTELPRIFLDYREFTNKDLKSASPQHTRDRYYLASMAKGSVWLTYRKEEQADYLAGANFFTGLPGKSQVTEEHSVSLGTVDMNQERIWVDLTNWIRLSADGVMTKRTEPQNRSASKTDYDLNLFAIAQRDRWQARVFNTYSRSFYKDSALEEQLKIPVYVSGVWGSDTSWQVRFEQRDERREAEGFREGSTFASARVETFKRSPFTVTPSLSAEVIDGAVVDKVALNARLETASTRRFSDSLGLIFSYDVKSISEESASGSNGQVTHTLAGKAQYRPSSRLVLSADQRLTLAFGETGTVTGNIVSSEKFSSTGNISSRRATANTTSYTRSETTGAVAWSQSSRLRTSAKVSLDLYDTKQSDLDSIMTFSGEIDYSLAKYKVAAGAQYRRRTVGGLTADEISLSGTADYSPTANVINSVRGVYTLTDDFGTKKDYTEVRQRFTYAVPSRKFNGKLFDLTEQATLMRSNEMSVYGSQYNELRQLSLQGKYFFTPNLFASAITRYSLLNPGTVNEWLYGATLGMNYRLLQGNIEYFQGRRNGADDNRNERRFAANLKKQF